MRRRTGGLAAALLVSAAAVAPSATAQQPAAGPASLRLLDRTAWVGDGVDFELTIDAQEAPTGGQLQVTVHDRVRSRSEFARSIQGEGLRRSLSGPSPVPVATLDADGDGAVRLLVPLVPREGVAAVAITRAGVYPVAVELLDAGGDVLDTLYTHLVRLPPATDGDAPPPLGVAVVIPLHAEPAHLDPAGPPTVPTSVPVTSLASTLAASPGVPVTLAPTPETLAAIASDDLTPVASLAAGLGGSVVLSGPWVELDEAAWTAVDSDEIDRQLTKGAEALRTLLGQPVAPIRLAAPGAVPAEVASMVDQGANGVVVHEVDLDELDPRDFPYTLARPFRLEVGDETTVPAVAADRGLSALAATAADDPTLAAHQILADLAVLAADEPDSPRAVTLVLPDEAATSTSFLAELLDGLEPPVAPVPASADPNVAPVAIPAADPVVAGVTVVDALDAVEPAGADGGTDADDPLIRRLTSNGSEGQVSTLARRLAAGRARLASLRGIFGPADPLLAGVDDVLATVAAADLEPAARTRALDAVDRAVAGRLGGLHGPERQRVTLTAHEGRIQLLLTNDTGVPANVALELRGDRLVLPDAPDGRIELRLTDPTTRVELRVEARSSGDAPLDIRLTSPDGGLDFGETRITVRTTAVSGVGIVLMGAAAAFLVVWWTRTILRDRRHARGRHPAHARHMRAG